MFQIKIDRREPIEAVTDPNLRLLLDYWRGKCAGRAMPSRVDIDPLEFRANLGRVHILDVLGPERFRFRIYGSAITNPDVRDMTGLTTQDYEDKNFAALVTAHYQECVDERAPVYRYVLGMLDGGPYEYFRLLLPLSTDGETVDKLLVAPLRVIIPVGLPTRGPFERG